MTHAPASNDVIAFSLALDLDVIRKDRDETVEWVQGRLRETGQKIPNWEKRPIGLTLTFHTVPPKAFAKRDHATLEAGRTVWRAKHPPADRLASVLVEALYLEPGQITRLVVEKKVRARSASGRYH